MSDVIDATGRFQRLALRVVPSLQLIEHTTPNAYETLILSPELTVAELMHELRHSDITLSTVGPFQILTRKPTPTGTA